MRIAKRQFGVVGLQRTGLAVTRALLARGGRVLATDAATMDQLPSDVAALSQMGAVVRVGDAAYEGLSDCEVIVISPGVPMDIPPLVAARQRGAEIIGEVELAYRLCPAPIIAITGTKGKTTTTTLLGEMLKAAGKPVVVAGNIGNAFIGELDRVTPEHTVVLEVSSFQLESTVHFRPHIACLLNIGEDHLDRYASMDDYIAAKMKIFANQGEGDFAVLNGDQPELANALSKGRGGRPCPTALFFSARGRKVAGTYQTGENLVFTLSAWQYGEHVICSRHDIHLRGEHNIANVLAASLMALLADAPLPAIREAIRHFKGVPHRLEIVDTLEGVTFVNDSQGTTPFATLRGLEAFDEPIVLIAGGRAKTDNFDALGAAIAQRCKGVVLIGEAAPAIADAARRAGFEPIQFSRTMDDAVRKAFDAAKPHGVVLLSPACASFDMFQSYEHRGNEFKRVVAEIKANG
ncbi:MAG: UDP-N-acetylmuramoyl-L-alanine--D-glutamate ligase [Abditibacteriales bacterium]|nr:UDP-N-acetylmuramoyl-L-alanine--D-glutamate ligase [Abditibacteriales bacterium]MDW8364792.1 UDP-N-acetylmuramoyl-L-alanine--D-glutamate ligase [Abditibacteriales bacterium]